MKIGIMADTHVGRNIPRIVGELRREAYKHAFTKAIDIFAQERVDYLIHAGDLFEKRSMTPGDSMFVKNELHRLINTLKESGGKNLRIFLTRGNHDGTSDNSTLDYIEHPLAVYLKVLGDDILRGQAEAYHDSNISVTAVSHHPYIATKFKEVKPLIRDALSTATGKRLLILHAFIKGYHDLPPGIPHHSLLTLNDLTDIDVDYIITGHFHTRKDPLKVNHTTIIAPGATEAIDLSDQGEYGVSILENGSYRFIPIQPLHQIQNITITSEDAVKPLEWYRQEAEARLNALASEAAPTGKKRILRLLIKGKSEEDPYRLNAEIDTLITQTRETAPHILHIQLENRVENTQQTYFKPLGGQEAFLQEALKPLGDLIHDATPLTNEVETALEERASQTTGLLTPSDRQTFVDRWMEILRSAKE